MENTKITDHNPPERRCISCGAIEFSYHPKLLGHFIIFPNRGEVCCDCVEKFSIRYYKEKRQVIAMRRYLARSLYVFRKEVASLPIDWVRRQKKAASLCERFIVPINHFLDSHEPQSFFSQMSLLADKLSEDKYDTRLPSDEREDAANLYEECREVGTYALKVSGVMSELLLPVLISRP